MNFIGTHISGGERPQLVGVIRISVRQGGRAFGLRVGVVEVFFHERNQSLVRRLEIIDQRGSGSGQQLVSLCPVNLA